MRKELIVGVVAGLFVTASHLSVVTAQSSAPQPADPMFGTWRLNIAKSKWSPGPPPKSGLTRIEYVEGGLKETADGVNAQGQTTHNEVIAKFDGKDYAWGADATRGMYRRIDGRTYEFTTKVNGKVTTTTRWTVSADGKTRTNTTTGKNAQGQTVNNATVYERQ
jgi:hypothetical protein